MAFCFVRKILIFQKNNLTISDMELFKFCEKKKVKYSTSIFSCYSQDEKRLQFEFQQTYINSPGKLAFEKQRIGIKGFMPRMCWEWSKENVV